MSDSNDGVYFHHSWLISGFNWGSFARSLPFCVLFCTSLLVLLAIVLSVFVNLRIQITSLVSSNFSFYIITFCNVVKYRCPSIAITIINATILSKYFSIYIVAASFIGEGNRSTRIKPTTCRNSLPNVITWCCIEYTSPGCDSNS